MCMQDNLNNAIIERVRNEISIKNAEIEQTAKVVPLVPQMPLELLPKKIQKIVRSLQTSLKYHPEYSVGAALFSVSLGIGNSFRVSLLNGWDVPAVIYLALIGIPGVGKTHPLSWMVAPFKEIDAKNYQTYLQEKSAANENQIKAEKNSQQKAPKFKKHILTDVTLEALAVRLTDNPRGVGVCIDELAGWIKNFNKYNKGSDIESWLSFWSVIAWSIDRKTSEPIFIRRPFVSVAGTIQPAVLQKLGADDKDSNGFWDRILFIYPENQKKEHWSDDQLDPEINKLWSSIVDKIHSLQEITDSEGNAYPNVIGFTSEAREVITTWQRRNTDRCNNDETFLGVGAKIEDYALRLSLIIQALFHACDGHSMTAISYDAALAATRFADYFSEQAIKVRDYMGGMGSIS